MRLKIWALLGADRLAPQSKRKLGVVALLYFIQGSPAAILWEVLPVYLRLQGISLAAIGGLRFLELPYSLKVLWSPLIHRYGDRRAWVFGCMMAVALVVGLLPLADAAQGGAILAILVLALTTLSATQDVAIDSYTVGLIRRDEEGPANGVRASAYRVALVTIGGGLVLLATIFPWSALLVAAALVFVLLGFAAFRTPRLDLPEQARAEWLAGFLTWIGTWNALTLILFALTYKLGEFAIGPMVKPFWVDQGRSLFEIGLVPTTAGIVLSVAGSLAGGAFISRYGTFRGIWALGLLQGVSNLGYALVAWGDLGPIGLYAASVFESFTGGLGTAAFLAFLMNVCEKEHATVQYALLSSIFALSGRLVGGISGLGAERFGYGNYFALTFLVSLPAFVLLPWVKRWVKDESKTEDGG